MTYQQIFTLAVRDCQDVYDETATFCTSRHIVEEMSDIVDYYLDAYPELIKDQERFRTHIFSTFQVDEAEYFY